MSRLRISFDEDWRFYKGNAEGAEKAAFKDENWRRIDVPHDWSIEGPFDKEMPGNKGKVHDTNSDVAYLPQGMGWYRKSFHVPADAQGQQIFVEFDGIYMDAKIWLNDNYLCNQHYGYSSFTINLTPFLKFGDEPENENFLAIYVNCPPPNSRWYSGCGIFRHTWLTYRDPISIAHWGTYITTPEITSATAMVRIRTTLENFTAEHKKVELTTGIFDVDGNELISDTKSCEIDSHSECTCEQNLQVNNPELWSDQRPYLYNCRSSVVEDETPMDSYETPFGIRKIRWDPNKGFFLNDNSTKFQGVCDHHDLGCLGSALNDRALERQLEILKHMGCNAIRTSHNPPAPELLDFADKMGFLIMDEAFDAWHLAKREFDYHRFFDEFHDTDLTAMIHRDRNHPCVMIWSMGNEESEQRYRWGPKIVRNLVEIAHREDPTRLCTHGCNSIRFANKKPLFGKESFASALDVVGYNYFGIGGRNGIAWYKSEHKKYPNRLIVGSESSSAVRTRGVYHFPIDKNHLKNSDIQCSSFNNSVVWWGTDAESSWRAVRDLEFVTGEFIWTGFDYLGETTPYTWPAKNSYFGIIDLAGFPKDIYYYYQSQWTTSPMVHILPHWNWPEAGKPGSEVPNPIPVWVYSNCDEVELFCNDKSQGKRTFTRDGPMHLEWAVPYESGILHAVGYRGGDLVAEDMIQTAGEASALVLQPDKDLIHADNCDLSFITIRVIDSEGILVPNANYPLQFTIDGPGRIVGVDNGNEIDTESFQADHRKTFNGLCLVVVRSTKEAGSISFTVHGDKFPEASVNITSM